MLPITSYENIRNSDKAGIAPDRGPSKRCMLLLQHIIRSPMSYVLISRITQRPIHFWSLYCFGAARGNRTHLSRRQRIYSPPRLLNGLRRHIIQFRHAFPQYRSRTALHLSMTSHHRTNRATHIPCCWSDIRDSNPHPLLGRQTCWPLTPMSHK